MNTMIKIREATTEDAARLVEIYSYYVLNTAVSFEYEVPSVEEFTERMRNVMKKYPYLVAVKDDYIVGYVYAGTYSARDAYSWTVANSIYVDKDYRRQGIGALMYGELEKRLKDLGIVNMLAGSAFCETEDEYLSHDSYEFHKHMGYEKVAQVGRDDVHQVITYMKTLQLKKGGFIVPLEQKQIVIPSATLKGDIATLSIFGIEISRTSKSYADFCNKMREKETTFVNSLHII